MPRRLRTPGPGMYNSKSAFGTQAISETRTSMTIGFGQPTLHSSNRGILPLEGRHSPGPIYMNAAACKKPPLSTQRGGPSPNAATLIRPTTRSRLPMMPWPREWDSEP